MMRSGHFPSIARCFPCVDHLNYRTLNTRHCPGFFCPVLPHFPAYRRLGLIAYFSALPNSSIEHGREQKIFAGEPCRSDVYLSGVTGFDGPGKAGL